MRSFWTYLLAPLLLLLLLAAGPAAASSIYAGRAATESPHHHVGDAWATAVPRFLQLAWLRDAVADWVFGGSGAGSGKSGSKAAPPPWHAAAHAPRYAAQTVLRFSVMTGEEEAALAAAAQRLFLDVWAYNNHTGTVDVRVDKEDVASLLTLLPTTLHHAFAPLVPDLAAAVRATYPDSDSNGNSDALTANALTTAGSNTDNIFFRDYQPYPVIVQWLKLLDVMFPFCSMVSVGTSAEGRDIVGLRVGASDLNGGGGGGGGEADPKPKKRKTILITGGLHAREWISTSSVCYVAWALITGYGGGNGGSGGGSSSIITKLVDNFDLVFVPVVNPDGYAYTWDTDRLWRKTRQTTNFRFCRGYDLDHAFGYAWDGGDVDGHNGHGDRNNGHGTARDEPCSETYRGEAAFQAVEAQALSAWARHEVAEHNVEFIGFLDLHSYSQQILFPYSYSCAAAPPNLENLEELAAGLAKAIRLSTGETYSVSSACEGVMGMGATATMGAAGSGSAMDWFYHELRAKYSYQIKLRDTGSYGFLLPSAEIVPTGEEVFNAVKYFGDFLLGNNGIEKSVEAGVFAETTEQAVLRRRR